MAGSRPKVAVFADTDSRWKWGSGVAQALQPAELALFLWDGPSRPTTRQLAEAGVDPAEVATVTIGALPRALAARDINVVVVALPGTACQAVLHAFAAAEADQRPVIVTGYVGVVYEKIVEGVLMRGGSDIVLANSPADARNFRQIYRDYGADPEAVVEGSLPFLTALTRVSDHPFTVTFAAQPSVPETRAERRYVIDRLAEHARRHPEREVLLKLRTMPGERVTHPEPYSYATMFAKRSGEWPPNFTLAGGPMADVLARTDLLVTVSSTAAIESIGAGIPTAILTDFGVREQLGTSYYAGSGCLASFADLDDGLAPVADPGWAGEHGIGAPNLEALKTKVSQLLGRRPLAQPQPFYTLRSAGAYLPRLLARHGLTPQGRELPASAKRDGRLARLTRSLSHSLYRKGAEIVAPALRKWGSS